MYVERRFPGNAGGPPKCRFDPAVLRCQGAKTDAADQLVIALEAEDAVRKHAHP